MRSLATSGAVLSILGLLAWLSWTRPDASSPEHPREPAPPLLVETTDGSAVPCDVPLAWRIARVDEGFGLSIEQARAAVARAGTLWEGAVGRPLFTHDSLVGFPVRLVYDERQASTQERLRLTEEVRRAGARLEEWGADLSERFRSYESARNRHDRQREDFQGRVARYNAVLEGWRDRGGVPEELVRELRASGDELAAERRRLIDRDGELEVLHRSLQEEDASFRGEVDEHRGRREALEAAFPDTPVESGIYREAVRSEGGRVVSVDREIRIYRFDHFDDLVMLAAHELGHALGLGHAPALGQAMSQEYGPEEVAARAAGIQPGDVELFHARCPHL